MVRYNISYDNPVSHLVQISVSFTPSTDQPISLSLPAWRPGRYELANYSKNIYKLTAQQAGKSVFVAKKTKNEWEIDSFDSSQELIVNYTYFAHQMDAGGSWLDEHQLYLNFINCMIKVEHQAHSQHEVQLQLPDNYQIACSLAGKQHQLVAQSYDELVDSPVIASTSLKHHAFRESNCTFHVWIQGNVDPDWKQLESQFRRYTKVQHEVFEEMPMQEYHYLFQVLPYKHYHGVEHKNSTVITLGPDSEWSSKKLQTNLLGISSHELFHAWNITRLKPKSMIPYQFEKEQYFEEGFIAEGVTTYYGDLCLARGGVFNVEAYFKEINLYLKRHFENEGRHELSLIDSSIDLWVDGYQVAAPHRKVSIYIKGALCALILDLKIREATNDADSLDDVMRELWNHTKDTGYTIADYQEQSEMISGHNLGAYFCDYIYGTKPLEKALENAFKWIGCKLVPIEHESKLTSTYGFITDAHGVVVKIAKHSPAWYTLSLKDKILNHKESSHLEVEIERDGQNHKVTIEPDGEKYFGSYEIQKHSAVTPKQENSFSLWCGLSVE